MILERVKNTRRNVLNGFAFRVLNTLLPFINRTILLKVLGVDYLGLNSLFTSILSVLSLAELGFGTALIYCMYKPIAEDDNETVVALLELYKKIYRWIGVIILGAGICISPFLRYFISGDVPDNINLQLVFFIQLGNSVLSYFFFAYKSSLLSAYQREDILSKVASWTLISQYLVQFIALFLTKDYYIYLIIIPFITLIRNILNYIYATKMFPQCNKKAEKKLEETTKQEISTKVKALFIHKVGGVITNSLDSVVVSAFLGLTATAMYNNYFYIISSVGNTVAIFYTSILAGIGNSVASESLESNYNKFNKLTIVNNWIVGWCTVSILCLYQPFMRIWVGSDYLFPMHTAVLFAVYFYVNMSRRINVTFKDAGGIWVEDRFKPLVSGMLNVILNLFLIRIIDIDGVVISTIISILLVEIPWEVHVLFKNYFKKKTGRYYFDQGLSAVVTVVIAALTYLVAVQTDSLCKDNIVMSLLLIALTCIVIPNMLFITVWRKKLSFVKSYLNK